VDHAPDEEGASVTEATSGVVVAGGAGRRFGLEKRAAVLAGRPLLAHAIDALDAVVDDLVVVTAAERPLPPSVTLPPGVRVVDDPPGVVGPLAGLLAGLDAARYDTVLVLGGDHAWAQPATLAALRVALAAAPEADAAVLDDGRRQPLVGAYRRHVRETIRSQLRDGDLRATALLDRSTVVAVRDVPGAADTARDVDHPHDLVDTGPVASGPADTGPADTERDTDAPDLGVPHAARTASVRITTVRSGGVVTAETVDAVTGEEPLEIRIAGPDGVAHAVTTTLRTPGHEADLAVGFLHAEGLLRPGDVTATTAGDVLTDARPDDHLTVHVRHPVDPTAIVHRHVTATASCGLCGRASIDDLLGRVPQLPRGPEVSWDAVTALPVALGDAQATFAATGGLHATGIATADGRLVTVREDVGRHNALDAAIGAHVRAGTVPLTDHLVVLSGRVGFELVQKVAVAGGTVVVAVGAPSDLAVRTAREVGLTLVGFVRGDRGNIYTHGHRVVLPS
jgi:FdhD protein